MFADISFPISSYKVFTYKIPEELIDSVQIGVRVKVPFGSRGSAQGVVVHRHEKPKFKGRIRSIKEVVDETPIFDAKLWDLLNWVSRHYLTPLGQVMRTAVPPKLTQSYSPPEQLMVKANVLSNSELSSLKEKALRQYEAMEVLSQYDGAVPVASMSAVITNPSTVFRVLEKKGFVTLEKVPRLPDMADLTLEPIEKEIVFSKEQTAVTRELERELAEKRFVPYLFHGVTGSGKTEIYIHLAQEAEAMGRHSILLLPEISLTPQIVARFRSVFGEKVALWHSRMSSAERAWTWRQICQGVYSVVVGARSAVFAPLRNVGLIIVDEEQEGSYKQESPAPRYHARDVALMRGKLNGALTVLASATPSLESFYNQAVGKYECTRLKVRYGKAKYPKVQLVDMMKEREETDDYSVIVSRLLKEKITERLGKNEQVILLQNRRGYSPVMECRDCGWVEMCRNCEITLTFHKTGNRLRCHYCGLERQVPVTCRECQGVNLVLAGLGTQKVEDALNELFPEGRLLRMDMDTTRRRGAHVEMLKKFGQRDYDILLGTQMIAKGLDFDNVTLVGVINADTGLFLPDFRAGERTFQLIYQVAGRSGRGSKPGEVVIQTNNADHPAVKIAAQLDLEKYYNIAMNERQELKYAPFSWMAKIEFAGKKQSAVENRAVSTTRNLRNKPRFIEVLGPAPCPLERIRGNYRYQVVLKSPKEKDKNGVALHRFLESNLLKGDKLKTKKGVSVHVDVDPVSLL